MSVTLNIFRFAGDLLHLISIILLILKIVKTKSCNGLSLNSQLLYGLVYVTRYLDLFHFAKLDFLHVYNFFMKVLFLASQSYILYSMLHRFKATFDRTHDTLNIIYLIGPCLLLSFIFIQTTHVHSAVGWIMELLWTFSIFLEAVAILPQLFLLQARGEAETITTHYLACLGGYRAMYILNWIYRYFFNDHFETLVILPGIVQTALYADFFYVYWTKVVLRRKFKLPV